MTFDTIHQALITHAGEIPSILAMYLGPDDRVDSLPLHDYKLGRSRRVGENSLVMNINIPQFNRKPLILSVGAVRYAKYLFSHNGPHMWMYFALGRSLVQCKLH